MEHLSEDSENAMLAGRLGTESQLHSSSSQWRDTPCCLPLMPPWPAFKIGLKHPESYIGYQEKHFQPEPAFDCLNREGTYRGQREWIFGSLTNICYVIYIICYISYIIILYILYINISYIIKIIKKEKYFSYYMCLFSCLNGSSFYECLLQTRLGNDEPRSRELHPNLS